MRLSLLVSAVLFGVSVYGAQMEHKEEHHKELPNYVAVKGMYTLGDDYTNEHGIKEEGDDGYGIAIDLGRRIGYGFAVEIDFSYERGDITVFEGEEHFDETVEYYTTSIDLAYVYELTHHFGVLAKVGYEYEYESLEREHIDDTGFVFAAGAEYAFHPHYKAVVEYEISTIDGPKGDAIFAGLMYNF
jgi:opacity protein-like surface antigen